MKINAVLIAALLSVTSLAAPQSQNASLLEKARQAFTKAQTLEAELNEKPDGERNRADYLKVINAYQRVYLITPRTGYADNALMTMARLYEQIKDSAAAIKTLNFLVHEYPSTPFKDIAEKDIARLSGAKIQKTITVDNVRYWETATSLQVIIDIDGEAAFKQGDAKNPDRIFIDIAAARLNSMLKGKIWPLDSGLVRQIRVGQFDNSTVRVVLETASVGRTASFLLRDPDRIVIDVYGKDAPPQAPPTEKPTAAPAPVTVSPTAPAPVPTTTSTAAAVPPPPTPTPTPTPAAPEPKRSAAASTPANKPITAAKAPNSGARSLVRGLGLKLAKVVIDAGHGGHDTGTIGPSGYTEKELVLDVAQRLKQLIETELGAAVVMTRGDDSFVPLQTRTAIANKEEADLFISIHANSSTVRSVRGVETYFLNFTSSREAMETASRENAASERSIHELQDLVKSIMLRDKVEESRELAQHIGKALASRKGSGMDRGVKQAPFVVLIGASMPSVLAEIMFISNPQDEKLVRTTDARQAIAESLFNGVRSYADSLSGVQTAKTQEKSELK